MMKPIAIDGLLTIAKSVRVLYEECYVIEASYSLHFLQPLKGSHG